MKETVLPFTFNNIEYKVFVTYKRQRNVYFRFKDNSFYVTCPNLTPKKVIMNGLNKYAPYFIKRSENKKTHYSFEEDYVYLLGKKVSLSELGISDKEQLEIFLKKTALDEITLLVRKYENIMRISEPYRVKVKHVSSRFASNSYRTHTLSFVIDLIHFSEDIISSVVVHELAHEFHRNHKQDFYNCVYLYCPNYKQLDRKLKKGIHE